MAIEKFNVDGFTIIRKLGAGARSVIYLATDNLSDRTVALKSAIYEKPEDLRIFEQIRTEYKIAKMLDHPYVRKCYKLIRIRKFLKVRHILLSMEMFEGQTLEKTRTLSMGDVLLVFRMVANGLNAMHQAGLIHCDIKPNNILINKSGAVRIIDLGQSCRIGTIKRRIQGTPDYIAPEQVHRHHLDIRTDIFNLGATMYWAITGRNIPTLIPQTNDISSFSDRRDFPSPNEIHRKIPFGVSKLVMDCLRQNPQDRPGSMMEVISRLDLLVHSIFNKRLNNRNGQ